MDRKEARLTDTDLMLKVSVFRAGGTCGKTPPAVKEFIIWIRTNKHVIYDMQ